MAAAGWSGVEPRRVRDMMLDALADEDLERVRALAVFEHVPQVTFEDAVFSLVEVLDHELAALGRATASLASSGVEAAAVSAGIERAHSLVRRVAGARRPST